MGKEYSVDTKRVKEWLTQTRKKSQMVDAKARSTFRSIFKIFEDRGWMGARDKLSRYRIKYLFDGIWEIRVDQYRIAYFWDGSICILLYGIKKQRDEWTRREKEVVKKCKLKYLKTKAVNFIT